jgi:hypothetical protein
MLELETSERSDTVFKGEDNTRNQNYERTNATVVLRDDKTKWDVRRRVPAAAVTKSGTQIRKSCPPFRAKTGCSDICFRLILRQPEGRAEDGDAFDALVTLEYDKGIGQMKERP